MLPSSTFITLFVLSLSCFTEASVFSDTCSSSGVACVNHEDNVIDEIENIPTIEECRQLCYDNQDCDFFTYYGDQSFPLRNFCFLMRTCEDTQACSGCSTETRGCFYGCSEPVVGLMEDNILDFYYDVESETDCKDHCAFRDSCTYYTYFKKYGANSKTCVLLSQLLGPLQQCDTCVTGPVDCSHTTAGCHLAINGESHSSMMFTEASLEVNVVVPAMFQTCFLRLFLGPCKYNIISKIIPTITICTINYCKTLNLWVVDL